MAYQQPGAHLPGTFQISFIDQLNVITEELVNEKKIVKVVN